jgi:4-hydroxyphenylpyruvate dioxygenase
VDHLTFVVGNARQAAHYYAGAFGMHAVAYRGPETGWPHTAEYILRAGGIRFRIVAALRPGSARKRSTTPSTATE